MANENERTMEFYQKWLSLMILLELADDIGSNNSLNSGHLKHWLKSVGAKDLFKFSDDIFNED